MIIKINNKDSKFYNYMGKFFGSRLVQKKTGDRIYDDDDKEWYIYLNAEKVIAFASINKNIIKNIYAVDERYLKELLDKISNDITVLPSVVTKLYINIYIDCKFVVDDLNNYKNFVIISSKIK